MKLDSDAGTGEGSRGCVTTVALGGGAIVHLNPVIAITGVTGIKSKTVKFEGYGFSIG